MSNIDINILPIHLRDGVEQENIPGLHAAAPPRRATRGRKNDKLIIFLKFEKDREIPSRQLAGLMKTMEKVFYDQTGTPTAAMRTVVEELNAGLIKHNLKHSGSAEQLIAHLFIAVIRKDRLVLAQCGPTHGFLVEPDHIEHIFDPQTAGRGLGIGQVPSIRFFQANIVPGTSLLLVPKVPSSWQASTLQDVYGQSLRNLKRRFVTDSGTALSMAVISTSEGNGNLTMLSSGDQVSHSASTTKTEGRREIPGMQFLRRVSQKPRGGDEPAHDPQEIVENGSQRGDAEDMPHMAQTAGTTGTKLQDAAYQQRTGEMWQQTKERFSPWLLKVGRFLGRGAQKLLLAAQKVIIRLLPGEEEAALSGTVMAIIATVVPLSIGLVAFLVYSRVGSVQQYDHYYELALVEGQTAVSSLDALEQRTAWDHVLLNLDLAESYRVTTESEFLRDQAVQALDEMDFIIRLDFTSALHGPLANDVSIRQMAATDRDLYMLDSNSGRVVRAWLTGTGYQFDQEFECGPGQHNELNVSSIVDLVALPRNAVQDYTMIALDEEGVLLYCGPDVEPRAVLLSPPPQYWGELAAITLENGNLYILDITLNAVWFYYGDNFEFADQPRFFFGTVSPDLQGVIDMAMDNDDLYLLYTDGHMVSCEYSDMAEAPTSCEESNYQDNRLGRESGPYLEGAVFYRITHSAPPDPSFFMLDPVAQSVYQFSVRLNLVRQYMAASGLPEGYATAVTISSNRRIFIALENEVFSATLP